jgi:hypothetical protein
LNSFLRSLLFFFFLFSFLWGSNTCL